jgi:DNA-binding response OmpR family regulator
MSTNLRVLVVDDDESIRSLVAEVIELSGYSCETAENGRQSLALMRQESFDLVLLDLMMPDMTGPEVLAVMGSTMPSPPSTVIMTAAPHLAPAGFKVLSKPFPMHELLGVLESAHRQACV